jgi:hypothetical protein
MFNFLINTAHAAVSLPSISSATGLPGFIRSIYSFALTIVGIAVFMRILYGGFKMLTAAGNSGKDADAKKIITNAVVGAILLFAAYLILYVINPDLVKNTFNFTLPKEDVSSNFTPPDKAPPTTGPAAITGVVGNTNPTTLKSGVPVVHAQEGVYLFGMHVLDAAGNECTQAYNLEVVSITQALGTGGKNIVKASPAGIPVAHADGDCSAVKISTLVIPTAVVGAAYYAEIYAGGGTQPYVFSIVNGSSSLLPVSTANAASGLPDGLSLQATAVMPILTIQNKTAPTREPLYAFNQGDVFHLELTNAKQNSTVYIKWQKNGAAWAFPGKTQDKNGWTSYGITDGSGKWVNEAPFSANELGVWYEWAMVDGKISRPVSFQVIAPKVTIVVAPPGQPAPGSGGGGWSGGGFTPATCAPKTYCENAGSGDRSAPLTDAETIKNGLDCRNGVLPADSPECQNQSDRCPGERQIHDCIYPNPADNLASRCEKYQYQFRNCVDDAQQYGGFGSIEQSVTGSIAPIASAQAGTLYAAPQTYVDNSGGAPVIRPWGKMNVVYCKYSDQAEAINCGASSSGEFCLGVLGSHGANSDFCAWPTNGQ